jgi:hypothetical protein
MANAYRERRYVSFHSVADNDIIVPVVQYLQKLMLADVGVRGKGRVIGTTFLPGSCLRSLNMSWYPMIMNLFSSLPRRSPYLGMLSNRNSDRGLFQSMMMATSTFII